jgi:hypothetical protein
MIMPVLAAVSQATLESGSSLRQASRMASETWSLGKVSAMDAVVPAWLETCSEYKTPDSENKSALVPCRKKRPAYQILSGWPSPTDSEVKRKLPWTRVRHGQYVLGGANSTFLPATWTPFVAIVNICGREGVERVV